MQRMGLEWLFRFASEPVRLWRRYLIGIPVFMYGVATDRWRRSPEAPSPVTPPATVLPLDAVTGVDAVPGLNVIPELDAVPEPLLPLPRALEIEFPLRPAPAGQPEESRQP
jgi:hypothetical protein